MSQKVFFILALVLFSECYAHTNVKREAKTSTKTKRQLYREQLLPHKGGKIPDSAFQVDRLAANRLSKVGISVPDGVLLEQRYQESHYNEHRTDLDILKSIVRLKQTPDGRFTPVEGQYPTFENEIESTYVIRAPVVENYNFILPAFRPNFAGSPAIQIPSKLTNNKIFREKNGPPRLPNTRPSGVRPPPVPQNLHPFPHQPPQFHPQPQPDKSINPLQLHYQTFVNGGDQGYIPNFPSLTEIPFTSFVCDRSGGLYPDPEAKCQIVYSTYSYLPDARVDYFHNVDPILYYL